MNSRARGRPLDEVTDLNALSSSLDGEGITKGKNKDKNTTGGDEGSRESKADINLSPQEQSRVDFRETITAKLRATFDQDLDAFKGPYLQEDLVNKLGMTIRGLDMCSGRSASRPPSFECVSSTDGTSLSEEPFFVPIKTEQIKNWLHELHPGYDIRNLLYDLDSGDACEQASEVLHFIMQLLEIPKFTDACAGQVGPDIVTQHTGWRKNQSVQPIT